MYKFVKNNIILWCIYLPLLLIYLFGFFYDIVLSFLFAPGISLIEAMLICVVIPGIIFFFVSPCGKKDILIGLFMWGAFTIAGIYKAGTIMVSGFSYASLVRGGVSPESASSILSEYKLRMYGGMLTALVFMIISLRIPYQITKYKQNKELRKNDSMLNDTLFVMNIFNEETKEVRRQVKTVNKQQYPLDEFSYNNEYFAVERFINDERKFFICTKKYWDENVKTEIDS